MCYKQVVEYRFSEDLKIIRSILGITQSKLAKELGVQQVTVSRNEIEETKPSDSFLEKTYGYAYDKGILLNRFKSMYWEDKILPGHKLLYHGAKSFIDGKLSVDRSRSNNDFGQGFYTGESYSQAISFISGFEKSSVYLLDFDPTGLNYKEFDLTRDWMMTIAFFRGTLKGEFANSVEGYDYLIAPIADNRMYQIINSFINGEITDQQCIHCLAATNLGKQYVFKTEKAISQLKIVEKLYVSDSERNYYKAVRSNESLEGENLAKQARIQYRGKGLYIDEILKH